MYFMTFLVIDFITDQKNSRMNVQSFEMQCIIKKIVPLFTYVLNVIILKFKSSLQTDSDHLF